MKRLESNLKNMVLSLTIISIVAASLLAVVYSLTKDPIAKAQEAKQAAAIQAVLPALEGLYIDTPIEIQAGLVVRKAYLNNELVGAAVEAQSNGFSGPISLMVGFDAEGNIVNYEVLSQTETPGLGTKVVDWFKTDKNNQSIIGKNPATTNLTVNKDGGAVDAITAATISSRAFLAAVKLAYDAYMTPNQADAHSGATTKVEETIIVVDSTAYMIDSLATEAIEAAIEADNAQM